jgi:hypothetical protein
MPLKPDLGDVIAKIAEDVRRLRSLVAQAVKVEVAASTSTDETITVAKNVDSGWQTLTSGPSLTVVTGSGKIVVTVSGRVKIPASNTGALGVISYEIKNAAGVQVVAPDLYRGVYVEFKGAGVGASEQTSFMYVHDGLGAGTFTINALYRYWDGAGATAGPFTADFINRTLIAKGY